MINIKYHIWRFFLIPSLALVLFACQPSREGHTDVHFTNLFAVDSGGVTGADGCISFPLKNGSSIFMMGDSFLDPVINGKRDSSASMINNTIIVVKQGESEITPFYGGSPGKPDALFKPASGDQNKEWYWPGHGFEEDGILHLFMSRFLGVETGWGFESNGTDYLRVNSSDFTVLSCEDFPFSLINEVHWGHSILKDDEFVYIYGTWHDEDYNTAIHACRAILDQEKNRLVKFQFFDGNDWSFDPVKTVAMKGIEKDAPEQFSIFKYGKTYILLMQERDLHTGKIYTFTSDSPMGPWDNEKLVFEPVEQLNVQDQVITYNAMAHPQYIRDGMLLASYCVNCFDIGNVHNNPEYYRPVFFRVPMQQILKK